jgi:hypothetical protein
MPPLDALEYAVHGEVLPGPGARGDDVNAIPEDVKSSADEVVARAVALEESFEASFMKRGIFPRDLYDDADRAPVGSAFPTSKAVAASKFVLRPDFQKIESELLEEEKATESVKKFGKAYEKGKAFQRLTAGTTTHPWDRDGSVAEREVEEHAMKEMEDDARRRRTEEHEARAKKMREKRRTVRADELDVD